MYFFFFKKKKTKTKHTNTSLKSLNFMFYNMSNILLMCSQIKMSPKQIIKVDLHNNMAVSKSQSFKLLTFYSKQQIK